MDNTPPQENLSLWQRFLRATRIRRPQENATSPITVQVRLNSKTIEKMYRENPPGTNLLAMLQNSNTVASPTDVSPTENQQAEEDHFTINIRDFIATIKSKGADILILNDGFFSNQKLNYTISEEQKEISLKYLQNFTESLLKECAGQGIKIMIIGRDARNFDALGSKVKAISRSEEVKDFFIGQFSYQGNTNPEINAKNKGELINKTLSDLRYSKAICFILDRDTEMAMIIDNVETKGCFSFIKGNKDLPQEEEPFSPEGILLIRNHLEKATKEVASKALIAPATSPETAQVKFVTSTTSTTKTTSI